MLQKTDGFGEPSASQMRTLCWPSSLRFLDSCRITGAPATEGKPFRIVHVRKPCCHGCRSLKQLGKIPPYGNLSFSYRLVLLLSRNKTQKTVMILQFKDHVSLEYGPTNLVSVIQHEQTGKTICQLANGSFDINFPVFFGFGLQIIHWIILFPQTSWELHSTQGEQTHVDFYAQFRVLL